MLKNENLVCSAPLAANDGAEALRDLLGELPEDLARQVFTHASWAEHRAESYERLAFLGDVYKRQPARPGRAGPLGSRCP